MGYKTSPQHCWSRSDSSNMLDPSTTWGVLDDRLKFLGNELGEYSVKKAYSILLDNSPIVARNEWKGIWQLSCYQRIRAWFWKVLRGCVPIKAFVYTRGKTTTMRCPRCNGKRKTCIIYFCTAHCHWRFNSPWIWSATNKRAPFNPILGAIRRERLADQPTR